MEKDGALECPRCWVEMDKEEVPTLGMRLITDSCPRCEGLWLDEGELHKVLKDRHLSDYLTKDIGTSSDSPLVCPRCKGLMTVERAEEVEVDVCLSCNGVWLDGGELEALRSVSANGFERDEAGKTLKRWDEDVSGTRRTRLERFVRKLMR